MPEMTDAEVFGAELTDADVFGAAREMSDADVGLSQPPGELSGIVNSFRRGNLAAQRAIEAVQMTPETGPTFRQGRRGFVQAMEDPEYLNRLMMAGDDADAMRKAESLYGPGRRVEAMTDPRRQANIATAENISDLSRRADAIPQSAAMQEWAKANNSNWWQVFARNPVEITANIFAESLPQAAPTMAATMATGGMGRIASATAGGAGSFGIEAANSLIDAAASQGVDLHDPEQVRAFFSDENKVKAAREFAMQRGLPIGLLDALTVGVAGKFLKPALGNGVARVAGATAAEAGAQMAGGAGGEALAQVASGQDWNMRDIAAEAIGELATAPGEVVSNLREEMRNGGGKGRGFEVIEDKPKPAAPTVDDLKALQAAMRGNQLKPAETKPAADPALDEVVTALRGENPEAPRLKGALKPVQPEKAGDITEAGGQTIVVERPAELTEEQRAAIEQVKRQDAEVAKFVENPDKNYEGMSRLELELLEGMGDARATAALRRMRARTNRRDAETQREKTPDAQEWEQLLKPDIRRDLRDEGVTAENVEALLSGKKTAAQVVDEQLGLSKSGGSIDATTMMVEENVDGSRSIGFAPPAGPASTTPVNVGQMSHVDAILMARDQGIERIQAIFGNRQTTSPPVEFVPSSEPPATAETITGSNERTGSEMPAEAVQPVPPSLADSPSPKPSRPKHSIGERPWDVIDEIEAEVGGKIDPSLIRAANPNWKPVGAARRLFRKGGRGADVVLNAITYGGPKLGLQQDTGLQEFGDALNHAATARQGWKGQAKRERTLLDEQAREAQTRRQFENKALQGERPKSFKQGVQRVPVDDLVEGDKFQVQDVNFTVESMEFDPDDDGRVLSVTLKDGPKFGTQTIEGGSQVIHIDEGTMRRNRKGRQAAGEFGPVEQGGTVSAPKEATGAGVTPVVEQGGTAPTLKSGQKQGDLLGSGDVAFNLYSDRTGDGDRTAAEKQERAKTEQQAKEFADKHQQELPSPKSRQQADFEKSNPGALNNAKELGDNSFEVVERAKGQGKRVFQVIGSKSGRSYFETVSAAKAALRRDQMESALGTKDAVESALDSLKADIKPGDLHAFGLIPQVWNGLIETVRLAYRGGKTIAQAIEDGLAWLQATHGEQQFDEAAVRAELQSIVHGADADKPASIRAQLNNLGAEMDAIRARGEEIPQAMLDQYKDLADTLGEEIRSGRGTTGQERIRVDENLEENPRRRAAGAEAYQIPQWRGEQRLPAGRLRDLFTGLKGWRERAGNWLARRQERMDVTIGRDAADNRAAQSANEASQHVRLALNRAFDTAPGEVRTKHETREAALTFVVEADGDRAKLAEFHEQIATSEFSETKAARQAMAAIEYAEAHWEKLQQAAERYRVLSEAERETELNEGVNSAEWRGGYVYHRWAKESPSGGADPTQSTPAGTPFRKSRSVATYAEGIAAGRKPQTLNALELLAERVAAGQRRLNELSWVHGLRNMIDPVTDMPVVVDVIKKPRRPVNLPAPGSPAAQAMEAAGETYKPEWQTIAPEGYKLWRLGDLEVAVQENFAGLLTKLTAPSFFKGAGVKKAFGALKSALLMFDTFHLGRMVAWRQMFGLFGGYQKGQTLLDFSTADIREMAARGEIPEAWADGLIENKRRLNLAIRTGFNIGNVLDNSWGDALHNLPGIGTFNKWLFGQYQRGAMAEAWLIEFERMSRALPNVPEAKVARRVSADLNARFGNLNRQGLFKSRTAQDLARFVFLAPQWNESLIRSELGAIGQAIKAPIESVQQRRLVYGTLMKATGLMAVGTFLANQILNFAFRGKPTWDNDEEEWDKKISAYIPDAIGGGPGFFLNPLALPMEYTHLIEGNLHRSGGDMSEALRRVLVSRLHAGARPVEIFLNRKDPLGRKLRDGEVLPAMAKALIPAPIASGTVLAAGKQLATGEPSEQFPGQYQKQLMASFGLKTDQAPNPEQRVRSLAREFNKSKGIEPSAEFFAGDYDELNKALRIGNKLDARAAFDELLKKRTPREVYDHYKRAAVAPFTGQRGREKEFWRGLTPKQREVYEQARAARKDTSLRAVAMLKEVMAPAAQ